MSVYGNLGPYELLEELGRGAMARVWRAWDPNLRREVAIKEPLFDPRLSEAMVEELGRRFVAEGRAAASLSHSGIVTIYAADVWDGRPAIVMELVDGVTLSTYLRQGPVSSTDAMSILDRLLDALGYAHARGVVHRDVKPDNIFVTSEGGVKLADFGIAHVDGAQSTLGTVAGTVLGTPGYMSPEQATGAPVDARSDLFSAGVVGYEMLAGRNPFGAGEGVDATTLIYRIVHEPAPEIPASASAGLPADMRPAIMAALSKDPDSRPQSADEFRAMLRGQGVSATVSRPARSSRPGWLPYAIVAGVAAVVLGFVLVNAVGSRGGSAVSTDDQAMSADLAEESSETVEEPSEPAEEPSDAIAETPEPVEEPSAPVEEPSAPVEAVTYYVSASNGYVAIFSSESPDAFEVSDVAVSDLGTDSAVALGAHMSAADYDEARAIVERLRDEAAANTAPPSVAPDESSHYILPGSDSRYYSRDELERLSDWELWMGRNEIYARHGRMFNNQEAQSYFDSQPWYVPLYTPSEYDRKGQPKVYNDYEAANRSLILRIEEERGSSYPR